MQDFPHLTEALSSVIKRLRKDAKFSQRQLAEISGVDRVYLLQIEQGKFRPTLNAIFFIAQAFALSPEKFVELVLAEIKLINKQ